MRLNLVKCLSLLSLGFLASCSDSTQVKDVEQPKPAYVTNAEYALKSIELNKTSVVAFQVKPNTSAACKHMHIEFAHQNAQGKWGVTNVMYPGKDPRNNFGQQNLPDQIQFAEVDYPGEFGIVALGCKPYGQDVESIKGLLATFKVEYGKVNYIGEIKLAKQGRNFYAVEVSQRTDFALEQIRLNNPALEPYFHESLMKKHEVKMSAEKRAEIERLDRIIKKLKTIQIAQDKVTKEHDIFKADFLLWEEEKGYPQNELSEPLKRIRKNKLGELAYLRQKISLYNRFIKEERSMSYVEKYMGLYDNEETHRKSLRAKYSTSVLAFGINEAIPPEQQQLQENYRNAREALREFERNNP